MTKGETHKNNEEYSSAGRPSSSMKPLSPSDDLEELSSSSSAILISCEKFMEEASATDGVCSAAVWYGSHSLLAPLHLDLDSPWQMEDGDWGAIHCSLEYLLLFVRDPSFMVRYLYVVQSE